MVGKHKSSWRGFLQKIGRIVFFGKNTRQGLLLFHQSAVFKKYLERFQGIIGDGLKIS